MAVTPFFPSNENLRVGKLRAALTMEPSNFSFHDWNERTDARLYDVPTLNQREIPQPIDRYRRGHLTMGKDVDRGLAIQRARGRKQVERNKAFFVSDVLPLIASDLNPAAWHDLARELNDPTFYVRGGFTRYSLGERASWVHHTETDKIAQAVAMGAIPNR